MPSDSNWFQVLLDAAKARDIELPDAAVQDFSRQSIESPLAQWVENNVTRSTLLTKEEHKLWNYIKKESIKPGIDQGSTHSEISLDETAIRQKIASLNASTRTLEQQTRVLKKQKAFLNRYERENVSARLQRQTQEEVRKKKSLAEVQHLEFLHDEQVAEIASNIDADFQEVDKNAKEIDAVLQESLQTHDRVLGDLENLHGPVPNAEFDVEKNQNDVQKLANVLHHIRVDLLKDRLDRIYLENLASVSSAADQEPNRSEEIASMKKDIHSLYTEVEDVMRMLISHEHTNALQSILSNIRYEQINHVKEATDKSIQSLSRFNADLDTLSNKAVLLYSHRKVLQELSQFLEQVPINNKVHRSVLPADLKIDVRQNYQAAVAVLNHLGQETNSSKLSEKPILELGKDPDGFATFNKLDEGLVQWQTLINTAMLQRKTAVHLLSNHASGESWAEKAIDKLDKDIAKAKTDLEKVSE